MFGFSPLAISLMALSLTTFDHIDPIYSSVAAIRIKLFEFDLLFKRHNKLIKVKNMDGIKFLLALTIFLVAPIQAKAALVWEWGFVQNDIYATTGSTINIEVLVRNSADSDIGLTTYMHPNDGSWESIYAAGTGSYYIPTPYFYPDIIQPGQEVKFLAAHILQLPKSFQFHGNNVGDIFQVDPIMYAFDSLGFNGQEKKAIAPLTVHITAVPLPATLTLFLSGLIVLLRLGKTNPIV